MAKFKLGDRVVLIETCTDLSVKIGSKGTIQDETSPEGWDSGCRWVLFDGRAEKTAVSEYRLDFLKED